MADNYGNCFHIGTRDCTIQRRHQKLIEEAPACILSEDEQEKVGQLAISIAKQVSYRSLGTVEFLYSDHQFYFVQEVSTKFKLNAVSEEVYGIDLVKEQIKIAAGNRLKYQPRRLSTQRSRLLNAESTLKTQINLFPWPGKITDFHAPGGPGVRVDGLLFNGYTVPLTMIHLLQKSYAKETAEKEAINMLRSLREMKIDGIRTNIAFHLKLLNDQNFLNNNISTNYLEVESSERLTLMSRTITEESAFKNIRILCKAMTN